jgi:hypothetical protein
MLWKRPKAKILMLLWWILLEDCRLMFMTLISVTSANLWNSTLNLIYPYLYTKLIIHMSYRLASLTPADDLSAIQIDKSMMDELKEVKKAVNPTEVLLVVDAMTGQEAAGIPLFLHAIVAAWVLQRARIL